jgi:hypothetical protein
LKLAAAAGSQPKKLVGAPDRRQEDAIPRLRRAAAEPAAIEQAMFLFSLDDERRKRLAVNRRR